MGVLEKIKRRQCYPVKLPNGETIHIRPMSIGESIRGEAVEAVGKNSYVGFLIGCALVEDNGDPAYTKQMLPPSEDGKPSREETDAEFGLRVATISELDSPAFAAIQEALKTLDKVPKVSVLAKNSEETGTPT